MARIGCSCPAVLAIGILVMTGTSGRMLQEAKDGILPAGFNDMLQSILPSAPYTLSGGSTNKCKQSLDDGKKSCTTSLSAKTATYTHGDRSFPVTICICQGGPYNDAKGLADEVARIPDFLLFFVKGVTSANAKVDGGVVALTYPPEGQIQVFVKVNARTLTHEAAHAQDYAAGRTNTYYTQSSTWRKAVSASTCSPTGYAARAGSDGETYGDAILPYVFNSYRGNKVKAFDTKCLDPELKAIDTYARSLSNS